MILLIFRDSANVRRHYWSHKISRVPSDTFGSFDLRGCPKTPLFDKGSSSGLIPWCLDLLQDSEESVSSSRSLQNLDDTVDFPRFRKHTKILLVSQNLSSIGRYVQFLQNPLCSEELIGFVGDIPYLVTPLAHSRPSSVRRHRRALKAPQASRLPG
jgi:hypothetical protein